MTISFQPAGNFANMFGVKSLVYGPPGRGKTPLCNSAPRPVLCASEPGLLSMRGSPVMTCEAYTPQDVDDFYAWLKNSADAKNFDTVCVDSVSQQAEILLKQELGRNKDGRKAYGEMARRMIAHMEQLYYTQNKHTYLICKQMVAEENGVQVRKPYFPGQELNVRIPHMFDVILHLDIVSMPGIGNQLAFRCQASYDTRARDRTGRLAEYEPPQLTNLFNKCLGA